MMMTIQQNVTTLLLSIYAPNSLSMELELGMEVHNPSLLVDGVPNNDTTIAVFDMTNRLDVNML